MAKYIKELIKKQKKLTIKVIEIDNDEKDFMKYIKNELKNMNICSSNNNNSVKVYEYFHYEDKELVNKFIIVMELFDNS